MAGEIVGRDEELAAVAEFLHREHPGALLLEGEPGIGKTTLWREGVRLASERGARVLSCRTALHETRLSFAGLTDLVAPVLDEVRADLPDPQRRALEVALLLRDPRGPPPDERAVGAALTTALRSLGEGGPILVAVDDVQWLDASTAATLTFALRRLLEEGSVALLLARRLGTDAAARGGIEQILPPESLVRLHLHGLSLGGLGRLLAGRVEALLPRPTLLRIHETSAGNPFYALELARGLLVEGELRPLPGPLPISATLDELLGARIAGLPKTTHRPLLLVACAGRPTLTSLARALPGGQETLNPAFAAGLIESDGRRVSFAHPLLAAYVYTQASDPDRRAAHAALAEAAEALEDRARHLALSVAEPDERVAAILEGAADAALARGAPSSAAELAVQARDLTPADSPEPARRRALLAGELTWVAGDYEQARVMLEAVVAASPAGSGRADALLGLARNPRDMQESVCLCREAWIEAGGDPALRSDIDSFTAIFLHAGGHVEEASLVAARGAEAAAGINDRRREALPRAFRALMELVAGRESHLDTMRAAAAVEEQTGPYPARIGPRFLLAQALGHVDELDEGRELLTTLETEAREDGDVRYGRILVTRSLLEVRAGRFQLARELAEEARDLWQDVGLAQEEGKARATLAQAEALLGLEEEARADISEARRLASRASEYFAPIRAGYAEVLLELSRESGEPAAASAEALVSLARDGGFRSPLLVPAGPCAVEAFVVVSRLGEAEELTRELEEQAERVAHPRLAMYAYRCRGLMLSAEGDTGGALVALERAREIATGVRQPLERARTLYLLGRLYLRANQRRAARATLNEALASFEGMQARLWADRARGELARISGRTLRRDDLTEAERRVAGLAAEGKTNKEIAAALFVTPKTVEFHLGNAYRKLGVRSRTELVHRLRVVGQTLGISLFPLAAVAATLASWLTDSPYS
ncbi:MAG: hypothetical protein C5B48_03525 [Candidatus Rokuibacteriota bacterium]|nr:MAG: hypothetical protein C5B48_03525 [Candidatus Rokubacteria bacterium]